MDVRNENNFSLKYYDDYQDVGVKNSTSGNPVSISYNSNSWPIHLMDSNNIEMFASEKKTRFYFALPIGTNTKNLCFFYHAPLYKRERFEFINRWPYFPKNEARFRDLIPVDGNATLTGYVEFSTFQTPDETLPVACYFRLFYSRQKEDQTIVTRSRIAAKHILDNLFIVKEHNDLLAKKETYNMRSWLDGNMRYIDRASVTGVGLDAQYSGMYKTGVAIDDSTITLFAVPFVIRGQKQVPEISLALPGSNVEAFLETLAGNTKDLGINSVDISRPGMDNIKVLNIYGKPLGGNLSSSEPDGFLGLSMTRDEYSDFELALLAFDAVVHPVFFQINSQLIQEVSPGSQPVNKIVLRMAGIDLSGNPHDFVLDGTTQATLFGLALNGSQFFNSDVAGSPIAEPLVQNPFQIIIGHNPYSSSAEREKFDEIRAALVLVHDFIPEEFDEIASWISGGREDFLPNFRNDNGNAQFFGNAFSQLRKYNIIVKFDVIPPIPATTSPTVIQVYPAGSTKSDLQPILIESPLGSVPGTTVSDILRPPLSPDTPYINHSDYMEKAINVNNSPEDIAQQYVPKIKIYASNSMYSDFIPITELQNTGRGTIKTEIIIRLSLRLRDPSTPPNGIQSIYVDNDEILVEGFDGQGMPFSSKLQGRFAGVSERVLKLAEIITHELGHFAYSVKEPLSDFAWHSLLSKKFTVRENLDPASEDLPSYTGFGHLEGDPSGNLSARYEYKFGKNAVENGLWVDSLRTIEKFGNVGNNRFQFFAKYYPSYARKIDLGTAGSEDEAATFVVSEYLRGNLSLKPSELPPKLDRNE